MNALQVLLKLIAAHVYKCCCGSEYKVGFQLILKVHFHYIKLFLMSINGISVWKKACSWKCQRTTTAEFNGGTSAYMQHADLYNQSEEFKDKCWYIPNAISPSRR